MKYQKVETSLPLNSVVIVVIVIAGTRLAVAEDDTPRMDRVSAAIHKTIPLLESAAAGSAKEKRKGEDLVGRPPAIR